ncbi:MAG: flagellar filament capping protein FliD [bacterium]|nr:flagellar filament capping protein FliD [bacterium]
MAVRISGMNSGLDTDSIVQDLVKAYSTKTDTYKKEQTTLQWKQDAWKALNTKIYSFYSSSLSNMRFSSNYNAKKTTVSDETKASVIASDGAVSGIQTLKITDLAKAGYLTGDKLTTNDGSKLSSATKMSQLGYTGSGSFTVTKGDGTTTSLSISENTTIDQLTAGLTKAGLNANFDSSNGRIYVSAKTTGTAADFSFSGDTAALDALGLNNVNNKVAGSNAKITLNGVDYESNSNAFTINGMTITVKGKTGTDEELSLSTDTDYDKIYDNIRNFFKEYNTLVNEMDSMYNAASSKGYDPLTDDEKSSMTDSQIEAWEKKIKDALLRRDDTVESVTSSMRMAMLQTYTVGGKTMSLSNFGINTMGYFNAADNEKNAYHIDGDANDSNTAGNQDKLKAAIASNPTGVQDFFTQLSNNLYDTLSRKMRHTELSSAFTVYDDIRMKEEYDDYTTKISDWEKHVADIEEKYYKQFTAMEKAMATLNSSQSALSGLLGSK